MPIFNYKCDCGYYSDTFVWKLEQAVLCPHCHKPMQRLFTGSYQEFKSNRGKPRPYMYDPRSMNATHDVWESCKKDFKRGRTDAKEVNYWKKEMQEENSNLIL